MLQTLQGLHSDIVALLDELEALTAAPVPDTARLASVRHRLTRASRGRTLLLEGQYARLAAHATPAERALVERLRAEGKDQLIGSARHIGTWSMRRIAAEWDAYRAASKTLRAAMRARVNAERGLYPLLRAGAAKAA